MKRVLGCSILLLVLGLPGPASAGVAESRVIAEPMHSCAWQVRLTYTDVRSERNTVAVVDAQTDNLDPHLTPGPSFCFTLGGIAVVDAEAPVVARQGCLGFAGRDAVCSYPVNAFPDPHEAVIDVGPMNDSVRVGEIPHAVTVQLGTGSDNGRVLNGTADTIACGPGTDQVIADAVDTVAADCEDVIRL